jgi:hypothetical protein
MKSQADKGRTERVFEAGDKVFLKLQPYLQSSVAFRANHKLAFKFYGPFEIEQKVGTVAYKLKLPANSLIHPVIHVSQLKKCVPSNRVEAAELPDEPPDFQEPEKILARRSRSLGSSTVREGLIRWTGMADTLATWENLQELRHRFPSAPAWGQAGSEEKGDVTDLPCTSTSPSSKARDQEINKHGTPEEREQLRRSKRERRRAARFSGPEWTA